MTDSLETALAAVIRRYPGPGGAASVLRDGEIVLRHAWGWANAELRIPFTPRSLFRICSISKQFTCAAVLDSFPDPTVLDRDIAARLPRLAQAPGALHLMHNQSGLRDYWTLAMLHGSPAEAPFGDAEAARVIAGQRTLQFESGTRFSYCNQNFRLLGDIAQERTGRGFADLLRQRVFGPAGMASAILAADTRALPDGTEGYEGSQATGFRPAVNRIVWTGDAGIAASLDDLIAWEQHVDACRNDPDAVYSRMAAPVAFADGAAAGYGFGLSRGTELGRGVIGHGGALRGWRSHRLYVPAERLSVVVLFNHLSDAHAAAIDLLAAALGEAVPHQAPGPAPDWLGAYIDPETGISLRLDMTAQGLVRLRYGQNPALLEMQPDGSALGSGGLRLRPEPDGLWMDRPHDNFSSRLANLTGKAPLDVTGTYRCDELDAELTVRDAGGALYGAFSGFLGSARMELLDPIGPDVWALPCPRALDHTPPGDISLVFTRDAAGKTQTATIGCWLARGLTYRRIGS